MSRDDLEQIQFLFGPGTDIIGETKDKGRRTKDQGLTRPDDAILATVHGRPVTKLDLVCSLGVAPPEVEAALERLLRSRRIRRVDFRGKTFFEPA